MSMVKKLLNIDERKLSEDELTAGHELWKSPGNTSFSGIRRIYP
jgi:hypothetical protein